jgi:hypothetical protein
VSKATADGAAVADRTIGDGRGHLAQHLAAGKLAARILEARVGDARTDPPCAAGVFQLLQRLEPRHVDQQRRPHKPQI